MAKMNFGGVEENVVTRSEFTLDKAREVLKNEVVAIIGYGIQGPGQALNLRDNGINVIVGQRRSKTYDKAVADGWVPGETLFSIEEACEKATVIEFLLSDAAQIEQWPVVKKHLTAGKALYFSHGFGITFSDRTGIVPPEDVDVIMVAPKGPGTEVRRVFEEGFGCPGLVAVFQDASGTALQTALAIAKAEGLTRGGVLECTMEQETYEDLFGEQNVLCGGLVDLMKYGFETLTEAGYPPEMAYFECVHEAKLIVDIIYNKGIAAMNAVISNTAEFGEYYNGPKIITPDVKKRMKESLERIQSGKFAKDWLREAAKGAPTLAKKREQLSAHTVEVVGNEIRKMFERK